MPQDKDLTQLLHDIDHDDKDALNRILPVVYDELRVLARSILRGERADHTLQCTALVHEAYLRLVDQRKTDWKSRAHFFALASMAIRRILVDHARRRSAARRGGGERPLSLDEVTTVAADLPETSLVGLDDALNSLAKMDAAGAQVVEMRFFGGLTHGEIAQVLGINERTVRRRWVHARAWLYRELSDQPEPDQDGPT